MKKAITEYAMDHPTALYHRKIDSVVKYVDRFEIVDGVLMKRVYDPVDHEVQLRLVAPEGSINRLEYPGEGTRPLGIREKILLEYHNGKIGGHLGAEKTARRILQDWYWPGVYDAVDRWCSMCDLCRGEKGPSAVSGWARTELYSRPFRVIQFDTVNCTPADKEKDPPPHGMQYILTAICCFSRWVWLVPIPDKSAETVGRALLERVILDTAMFPTVLRSDRAKEFTGSVIAYINSQLEIRHVLGSSYHPQSQGVVERMHRTMKAIGQALAEKELMNWPAMLPYAQCVLRILPLKSLSNRSPYEVVTGLRPRLPSAMLARFPVQEITVDMYVAVSYTHLTLPTKRIV